MFIRFCLCFGMGCTPSLLPEANRSSRKNSDVYATNGSTKTEIIQDSSKCNQILVNPYQDSNKKQADNIETVQKKDSIVSVATIGHVTGFSIIPTVRRSTTCSKYLTFQFVIIYLKFFYHLQFFLNAFYLSWCDFNKPKGKPYPKN